MNMRVFATACAALTLPAALSAQTDPNQPANNGSAAASATVPPGQIAAGLDPATAGANANVQGSIIATNVANANLQAQQNADLAAYDAALQAHGRQVAAYTRQRRAYADAMAAWRVQVAACQQGHQPACKAPAPDPASFY